jgi:hypothetical protein
MPSIAEPARARVVLELSGELDVTHAAALGVAVSAAVASVPQIAVDLTPRRPTDAVPAALPFWRMRWIV